jgi:DNA-binding response OmpR family regulator
MYTVLVCDDDKAILDSVKIYLDSEGYNVLTASDGIKALEVIEGNGLGLSIADDLCKLQGGSLAISIDGDLFKVTVKLPKN